MRVGTWLLVVCAILMVAGDASAQKKKKKPPKEPPPVEEPVPAEDPAVTEAKNKAVELYAQGNELMKAKDFEGAIKKFEEAFELYQDPALQLAIGVAWQLRGDAEKNYDHYRKAVEYFESYVQLAPGGAEAEAAKQRIEMIKKALADYDKQKAEEEAEAKAEADKERAAKEEAERQRLADLEKREHMQVAVDGMVLTGLASDMTAIPRGFGGALFNWDRFGIEAHLGFDFFFRLKGDGGGVAARTATLDIGARYGFRNDRFLGPFVAGGAGFGLMLGSPRERRLESDAETCMAQTSTPDCSFDLDKNLSGRLGMGWGFEASKVTTVALRIDFAYWLFSVDGEQSVGSPPARFVERPQDALSLMVGLEFLRWM